MNEKSSIDPRGKDLFWWFLAGFILLYGAVSLFLEHGLGMIGFSKTPFLNAGAYLYVIAFAMLMLLRNQVSNKFLALHPLSIALMMGLLASALIGVSSNNPAQYIVAWSLYLTTGILMFQLFRHRHGSPDAAGRAIDDLYALPFLSLVLLLAAISIFYKDNHYQYVLFEVLALYAVLIRRSLIEKAIGLAILLLVHLGSNDGFVQVEINRASILAVGPVGLAFMLYRRYLVTLVFLIFAAVGGLMFALSLDDATVDNLPRNIKEAILLMKGDDIYNHVSSYQRIYEGQKVMEDFQTASDAEWLFGKGLGRTVDMTLATDPTVGQHALLGALEVHNIHFLHFAVFHKFGLVGLGLLGLLVAGLLWMLIVDLWTGAMTDVRIFFYFYLLYGLVFALPASNFLIANPLWPVFLGMLCWLRAAARQVSTDDNTALTSDHLSGNRQHHNSRAFTGISASSTINR